MDSQSAVSTTITRARMHIDALYGWEPPGVEEKNAS